MKISGGGGGLKARAKIDHDKSGHMSTQLCEFFFYLKISYLVED